MSPCTAKLSAFRSKQVGKYVITPSNPNQSKPNQTNAGISQLTDASMTTEASQSRSSPRHQLRNSRPAASTAMRSSAASPRLGRYKTTTLSAPTEVLSGLITTATPLE
jgi:hypothetical protein